MIPVVGVGVGAKVGAAPVGASPAGNCVGVAAVWLAWACDTETGKVPPTAAGEAPEGPACCICRLP